MKAAKKTAIRQLSRRQFIGGISASVLTALAWARSTSAMQMIVPPRWLHEAYDIMRAIQRPVIPRRESVIYPPDGDARPTIQDAIDAMSLKGGGRVTLSSGVWRSIGPLRLQSKVELHLSEGALLTFNGDRRNYLPVVYTRWEGTELYGYSPCVYAFRVHDVAITGKGALAVEHNGDMEQWRHEQTEAQKRLRFMGATGVPLHQRVFAEGSFLRPSFIQFFECKRVAIEGISIGSIPFWGVHLLYSTYCTVSSIKVQSAKVNNDGVDVDSSTNVLIDGCYFETGDDCIAIKSGRDLDGRAVGRPSENIVIRDCRMKYSKSAGVAIGSEMSGGVGKVFIIRCDMDKVDTALNIKANRDRGGCVQHVRAWNLRVRQCERALQITTTYHGYMGGEFPPRFEDIELSDLRCNRARQAISIKGDRHSPVRRVVLKDFTVDHSDERNEVAHAKELLFDQVFVNGDRQKS
ncbi:MAG: glycoside hydrolase family 28 protein [Pseudomonadota bacterium]|jgi:polygalacturonase